MTYFDYDGLGRQIQIDYPIPEPDVDYAYNALGWRTAMTDGLGTTTWQYDGLGFPTIVTSSVSGVLIYANDLSGNRTSITYPDEKVVQYVYDPLGRLVQVVDWDSAVATYTYNVAGQLVSTDLPNGVTTTYLYDGLGQLVDLTQATVTETLSSFQYAYDAVGNLTQASETMNELFTPTPTPTPTATATDTPTSTPTETDTPTITPTSTDTPTSTPTDTQTPTNTPTSTDTPTVTPTDTPTNTPTPTDTATPTVTPTDTPAPTNTFTPTPTNTSIPDLIFADGFESGDFSAWSSYTPDPDLSVSPDAAMVGVYGMRANINDLTSLYVTDFSPNSEPRYRARFYFDPNSITSIGSAGAGMTILNGIMDDFIITEAFRVEFVGAATGFQVRVLARKDDGGWLYSSWVSISDAPHYVEIDWQAASGPEQHNGSLTLWTDGTQRAELTTIDNDTFNIDRAQLGAVAGIPQGMSGALYFDAFESHRQTYIGPEEVLSTANVFNASPYLGISKPTASKPDTMNLTADILPEQSVSSGSHVLAMLAPVPHIENLPSHTGGVHNGVLLTVTTITITYSYDPLDRLVNADYSYGDQFDYRYDAMGNVLTYTKFMNGQEIITNYTHDEANQLITARASDSPTTWYYTYNANGSLVEITTNGLIPGSGARRYTYNTAGYLVGTEIHDGMDYQPQAEMVYNGLGQRTSMTAYTGGQSVTTNYVVDILRNAYPLVATADGQSTYYLYGLGAIAEYSTGWSYYLADGTNTVRQVTDANAVVTYARRLNPWGEVLSQSGDGGLAWGYFGGTMDAATGLLYMGNGQYYDPATGRFLTRQPGLTNPYVPWRGDPLGAVLGPLGLLAMLRWRKRGKRGKIGTILLLLLVTLAVGAMLAACGGPGSDFPYTPEPPSTQPLPDTPIIDMPWVDEQSSEIWNQYPNSCGASALYMFLEGEGVSVNFDTLVQQLQGERPGGYDPYCCVYSSDWPAVIPSPTPGSGWCNRACVSAEILAEVARKYYGLNIESGDNWTRQRVHEKLMNGHPVLALIRADLGITTFGHFVVIRGLVNQGATVIFNDSYPNEEYWDDPEARQASGEMRSTDWSKFDISWASYVDADMDPLASGGHVRWAMAVR